ncbi:MAG: hypothetical protein JSW47_17240 [Phycisphaerales bacterium]|nr:MAG: hypothetical protein JSW47_17240 [Phycisphaerales bacterium]
MQRLSEPDQSLVSRVINEVSFEERLIGYRMRERAGALMTSLYSFEEVVHLLNDKFPRLSFQRLEEWLRTVIRDEELAAQIADAVEQEGNDRDRTVRVRMLMGERLCQCKKANEVTIL